MKINSFLFVLCLFVQNSLVAQKNEIIHALCESECCFTINHEHPEEGLVYLDYDQDGENDHFIFTEHVYWGDCQIRIQGVDGTKWRLNPRPCAIGDTISNYADSLYIWPWYVLLRGWEYNYYSTNNEYPNTYYSVRKQTANGYLYAWWRISIIWKNDADVTLVVHEMAYCTEPGYPLRVGQTSYDWGVGQQEETAGLIVQPNPTSGMVAITGSDLERVEVFNPMGQRIESKPIHSDASSFDLSAFPSGVYLLNVADKHGRHCIKKIVIQH